MMLLLLLMLMLSIAVAVLWQRLRMLDERIVALEAGNGTGWLYRRYLPAQDRS